MSCLCLLKFACSLPARPVADYISNIVGFFELPIAPFVVPLDPYFEGHQLGRFGADFSKASNADVPLPVRTTSDKLAEVTAHLAADRQAASTALANLVKASNGPLAFSGNQGPLTRIFHQQRPVQSASSSQLESC